MKTFNFVVAAAALMAVFSLPSRAQSVPQSKNNYEPRENWPYKYEDFFPGSIRTLADVTVPYEMLNVNIIDGKLHYVDDGIIHEANMSIISAAKVGDDIYLAVGGKMMQVLDESPHGAVVRSSILDKEEMAKVNIGYGKSMVASTQDVSLMSLEGSNMNTKSLISVQDNKYSGKVLPTKDELYLVVEGRLIKAQKSDVAALPWVDAAALKTFIKENKIKWRKPADLTKVVEYLAGQMND